MFGVKPEDKIDIPYRPGPVLMDTIELWVGGDFFFSSLTCLYALNVITSVMWTRAPCLTIFAQFDEYDQTRPSYIRDWSCAQSLIARLTRGWPLCMLTSRSIQSPFIYVKDVNKTSHRCEACTSMLGTAHRRLSVETWVFGRAQGSQ